MSPIRHVDLPIPAAEKLRLIEAWRCSKAKNPPDRSRTARSAGFYLFPLCICNMTTASRSLIVQVGHRLAKWGISLRNALARRPRKSQ
jgi:hypothetical protein